MKSSRIKDKRSFDYLNECFNQIKKDIGFIKYEHSFETLYDKEQKNTVKKISKIFFEFGEEEPFTREVGRLIKLEDDLYVLEGNWVFEDDCGTNYEFFSKEIEDYEYSMYDFITNLLSPFGLEMEEEKDWQCICMECLSKKHWLDNEGDLLQKLYCLKNSICSDCLDKSEDL